MRLMTQKYLGIPSRNIIETKVLRAIASSFFLRVYDLATVNINMVVSKHADTTQANISP